MLLRSISKHLIEQNWTAVALDFFIVIVGVFIGIQVANWNEALGERELEKSYLLLLERDLGAIEESLSAQVMHEELVTDAAADVLARISKQELESDPIATGQALMEIWGRRTLTIDSPVFSELKSAGRLSLISDIDLRNRLMAYFDGLTRTELLTEKNNDFIVEPYTAFLRNSGIGYVPADPAECGISNESVPCLFSRLLVTTVRGESTNSAKKILSTPYSDPFWMTLRAHVSFRVIGAISNHRRANLALEETQEIRDLLLANR